MVREIDTQKSEIIWEPALVNLFLLTHFYLLIIFLLFYLWAVGVTCVACTTIFLQIDLRLFDFLIHFENNADYLV